MLKIGNKIFKVLALAGLFLSFPLLTWLPAAPGQARFQTGFNPAWSLNSSSRGNHCFFNSKIASLAGRQS